MASEAAATDAPIAEDPRKDVTFLESQFEQTRVDLENLRKACPQLKIWVLTWNLGAAEPFGGDRGKAPKLLGQFVPSGYDLYVVGVQEAVSEEVYEAFEQRLSMTDGISRLNLATHNSQSGAEESSRRPDQILGRGDGSMLHPKYTGIAMFARDSLVQSGRIRVLKVVTCSTAVLTSKGGAAALLSIDGQTIVFISCHLEAGNKFEERRAQYRELSLGLGSSLGEKGFDMGQQFHHTIWIGDMNYRCVQGAGRGERDKAMDGDRCVGLLESGRHRAMFENHDQLSIEIKRREVYYDYCEPSMAPDFYPTYKKFENRGPTNYLDMGWVRKTYHVHFREPIYKGGRVKDRTPGWCDRILYHSQQDIREELVPEKVPMSTIRSSGNYQVTKGPVVNHNTGEVVDQSKELVDHYYSVNDGQGMSISDHSPVVAGFLFQSKWKGVKSDKAQERGSVRLDGLSLIVGTEPAEPASIKVLFPVPYEAAPDNRLIDVYADSEQCTANLKTVTALEKAEAKKGDSKGWSRMMKSTSKSDDDKQQGKSATDNLPPFQEVSWTQSPNSSGGLTSVVNLPDSNLYELSSQDNTTSNIPWLQLEYGGERDLSTLHVALQVTLRSGEFGHCLVSLQQVYEERKRNEERQAKTDTVSEAKPVQLRTRFVEPVFFRGLPLQVMDPSSGELEVVTAVFELSLRDGSTKDSAVTALPPAPP